MDRALEEIAALGATHVALVVTWSQRDVSATAIAPNADTPDDADVRRAIRAAHARGLKVLLFPILTLVETRRGQWRGTVAPADVGDWWMSYEAFILHYAAIAVAEKVAALSIGSELGSTETWRYRWYHLISKVERLYDGDLVYSANWDHYRQVSFWMRLDYIGVNGYFELTSDRNASAKALERAWVTPRAELSAFARQQGKPIWMTEVGYASRDGAAVHPWDYTSEAKLDLEEQRRCYQALRNAWDGVEQLGAVFIWNWHGKGGRRDRDYTPRGKPAQHVLEAWFKAR